MYINKAHTTYKHAIVCPIYIYIYVFFFISKYLPILSNEIDKTQNY